jgi:hypothetical protein
MTMLWGSEKGINKKLRDHIMEKHTNNNKQQPWELNTWGAAMNTVVVKDLFTL